MDYCGPAGIALAQFREWDEVSYAAALAWQTRRDRRCGGCGQPLDESTDPDRRDAYEAHQLHCGGCAAIARGERRLSESAGQDRTAHDGVKWRVVEDPSY